MSNFGARLKEARNKMGITQKDLSSRLGIAQSTVANYEKNTRFPGETILREISEYLNTSTDHLLGIDEVVTSTMESNVELTEMDVKRVLKYLIEGKGDSAKEIVKEFHTGGLKLTDLINNIFVPVLHRLGVMWETGSITVAQEHYSTGIIASLIDYLSENEYSNPTKKYTALFMVPGDEEHVLSLKMVSEFFKESGWEIVFIGRSIPFSDFKDIIKRENIDLVVLSVFSSRSLNSAGYLIRALKNEMGTSSPHFLIGGRGADSEKVAKEAGADMYLDELSMLREKIDEVENILR